MLNISINKENYVEKLTLVEELWKNTKVFFHWFMLYLIFFWLHASPVCTRFPKEFGPVSGNWVTYHSLNLNIKYIMTTKG